MPETKPLDQTSTISGLHTAYRNGSLSPVQVVEGYLDAISTIDPLLGAYQATWAESALAMAWAAEKALDAGYDLGPFHGVPFALKDIFHVRGTVTTCGSAAMLDHVAETTSPVVSRLMEAGGIILGKTKTVECAFGGWGTNQKMGTPKNPWDMETHRIPGGSSSGSAVAVASGMAVCGVGSDTGGSVRMPAAYCGIVGLKVTAGRLPLDGIMPLSQTLDSPGPMTQTVEDAVIMLEAMDGREGWKIFRDLAAGTGLYANLSKGVAGLRLGAISPQERDQCAADILEAYDMALDRLAALGARIDVFDNPVAYGDLADDNGLITAVEAYANHGAYYGDESLPMDEDVRKRMLTGQTYSGHEYVRKLERRDQLIREFGMCIEGFDALVTPSTIGTAPALSTIDQAIAPGYFTRPFNYLAMCALSVPISLNDSGLPTSLQIVGRAHDEAMVLRIGAAFEKDMPPIGRPVLV